MSLLYTLLATLFFITVPLHAEEKTKTAAIEEKDDTPDISFKEFMETFVAITGKAFDDYVEKPKLKDMLTGALNGMLHSLDPHSEYFPPKEFAKLSEGIKGEFGGLGMVVSTDKTKAILIIAPIDDTPAKKAGIQAGDLILAVDGVPTLDQPLDKVVEKLHGTPGTKVTLILKREGKDAFEVTITRAIIKVDSVKWQQEGNVGYIRISTFDAKTKTKLLESFEALNKAIGKGKMEGLVIDVRNNPGGLLDQGIAVSDMFIDSGEIVSIRGRSSEAIQRFNAAPGDMFNGLPVVVLINGGSASASEILAGAIQDNNRGIVVGTKSFGKGSVQTVYPMTNKGGLKMTTARYYTPSGKSIQQTGIIPDVIVEQVVDLATVDESGRFKEETLDKSMKNEDKTKELLKEAKKTDKKEDDKKEEKKGNLKIGWKGEDIKDYQMIRAVDIVRAIALHDKKRASKKTTVASQKEKAKK